MSESKFSPHINGIIESFVCACSTEEEIEELLAELSMVDWKTAIAKKQYDLILRPCGICHEWKGTHAYKSILIMDHRGVSGVNYSRACTECIEQAPYSATCFICSKVYPSQLEVSSFTCSTCFDGQTQVSNNNVRARKLGLPATLTLLEWTTALRHFNHLCAYCGGKYECMEHYVPLRKNGTAGTTVTNCLPACQRCNTTKGKLHPDTIGDLFPAENLVRIRSWLEQQKQQSA